MSDAMSEEQRRGYLKDEYLFLQVIPGITTGDLRAIKESSDSRGAGL